MVLIRFTQASALNDPWDMSPHVERLVTENETDGLHDPRGQGDSYKRLGSRTASNIIPNEDLPDAYPRVYRV